MPTSSPAAPTHHLKCLTPKEMIKCRHMALCFNRDEPFTHGHKCKHLFDIMLVNDYDNDDTNFDLMMMIGTQNLGARGWRTIFMAGAVLAEAMRILDDTSATHNVIGINFAWLVGLMECGISTMILVNSGNEIA